MQSNCWQLSFEYACEHVGELGGREGMGDSGDSVQDAPSLTRILGEERKFSCCIKLLKVAVVSELLGVGRAGRET